jgi:hypothetical protein
MYDNDARSSFKRHFAAQDAELTPRDVQPFGRGGVGVLTGHPVGLLVILAVILLTVEYIPAAGWFFVSSLVLGGLIGFALWLRHR